jgi:isochorismate synthase
LSAHLTDKLSAALSASPARGRIRWVTLPVAAGNIANLLRVLPRQELWAFETRDGEICVGLGSAASIGLDDLDRARARRFLTRTFAEVWSPVGPAAVPRVFGAAAFSPQSVGRAPWRAFPALALCLPRWTYACRGGRATLSLAWRGEDSSAARRRLKEELLAIQSALASPKPRLVSTAARPGARTEKAWTRLVEAMLREIRAGRCEKLVAARATKVPGRAPWSAAAAFEALRLARCTAFALRRGGSVFLGATPERLVSVRAERVSSEALAGTAPRGRTAQLRGSEKDRREHLAVVSEIARRMGVWCRVLDVAGHPAPRRLRDVVHLATPIEGLLRRPAHALDLALALHPTPAVCGLPVARSQAWIASHEPLARGWYAGFVGYEDAAGDGDFHVAIRSGILRGRSAWVFSGAGIVEGSQPSAEYEETELKQRPFLRALGVSVPPRSAAMSS